MKKFLVAFSLVMLLGLNLSAYADCGCTSKELVDKISSLNVIEKDYLVDHFLWGITTSTKTEMVNAIKDTSAFRYALKNYINSNCSISNDTIICR